MNNSFKWDNYQSLTSDTKKETQSQQNFDWQSYQSIPQYDSKAENQEKEGFLKARLRDFFQIPKGLANLTIPGLITNALSTLGTGEALSGLQEDFSPERISELRQKFPGAFEEFDKKYPTYQDFERSYMEGLKGAQETFPTVENISQGIENLTGLPLASKEGRHELIQFATGFSPAIFAKLSSQPSKFSNIVNNLKNKNVSEPSLGPALQQQLAKNFTQGEIIQEGRRLGLSDAEIAPLLNSERKVRFLSKFAQKGERSKNVLSKTQDKLSGAYETLKTSEAAASPFGKSLQFDTLCKLQQTLEELPSVVREGILSDTKDLLRQPHLNGKNLINYRQKIEGTIRSDPEKYKQLSVIKKVIDNAILKSNPQLAREYNGINRLYANYAKISSALKPNIADKFVSKGEALAGLYGVLTFNVPLLTKIAGEAGARRLITETLINPKFQQLNSKLISALNENKLGIAAKLAQSISNEVRDVSPELADEIEEYDWEDF